MSAVLKHEPQMRPMSGEDIDAVMAIEQQIYEFPWTGGNFRDSLSAGYSCWMFVLGGECIGYSVISIAAGEAHLLNLSIAAPWQRQGLGRVLLDGVLAAASANGARTVFLEVRPSNAAARALYERRGFRHIGTRRNYYPACTGREDAVVLALDL